MKKYIKYLLASSLIGVVTGLTTFSIVSCASNNVLDPALSSSFWQKRTRLTITKNLTANNNSILSINAILTTKLNASYILAYQWYYKNANSTKYILLTTTKSDTLDLSSTNLYTGHYDFYCQINAIYQYQNKYYALTLNSNTINTTYINLTIMPASLNNTYYYNNQLAVLKPSFLAYLQSAFLSTQANSLESLFHTTSFNWNKVYQITLNNLVQYLQFKLLTYNVVKNKNGTFDFSTSMCCVIGLQQVISGTNLTSYFNYFVTTFTYKWNNVSITPSNDALLFNAQSATKMVYTNPLVQYSTKSLTSLYKYWSSLTYFANTTYTKKPITTLNPKVKSKIGYLVFSPINSGININELTPIVII